MKDYENIFKKALFEKHYFTNEDLRMNRKYNILLESQELREYLIFKDNFQHESKIELPLKSFNSPKMYFYNSNELNIFLREYLEFINNDLLERESTIISDNYKEIILSKIKK